MLLLLGLAIFLHPRYFCLAYSYLLEILYVRYTKVDSLIGVLGLFAIVVRI